MIARDRYDVATCKRYRLCRACEDWKAIDRFELVRNARRATRRRVCRDCRLPDLAAYNRASRERRAS